jgi:hypothetical protein
MTIRLQVTRNLMRRILDVVVQWALWGGLAR